MTHDRDDLLEQARARTSAVLAELLAHQKEFATGVAAAECDLTGEGAKALQEAVDAAERLLHSIDLSLKAEADERVKP